MTSAKERSLPVFAEADRIFERVQRRAFDLFAARGFGGGRALEDWLSAEHEVCGPAAKLVETQNDPVADWVEADRTVDDRLGALASARIRDKDLEWGVSIRQ